MANERTELDGGIATPPSATSSSFTVRSKEYEFQYCNGLLSKVESPHRSKVCSEEGALACVRGAFKTYPAGSTVNAGLSEDLPG